MPLDRIEEAIMDIKIENARTQERIINIERYMVKDLKTDISALCSKTEVRFKWTIGLFFMFLSVSIAMTQILCGNI